MIQSSQALEFRLLSRSLDLFLSQRSQAFEPPQVTRLEKRIQKHREECGRKRKCQTKIHAVLDQTLENQEQRKIDFR